MVDKNGLELGTAARGKPGKTLLVKNTGAADMATIRDTFGYSVDPIDGSTLIFSDLDSAISACRANLGDDIYISAGYTETVTTAGDIAFDVAGISVYGLGNGDNRPVFTFGSTDNTASITITADDCAFKNVVLLCNDDALTNALNITGNDAQIDIESQDGSAAIEFATVIRLDTADNANVKLRHVGFAAGNAMVSCIRLDDCDNVRIDIDGYGVLTTAWVEMVDVASSNVTINGRVYTSGITTGLRNAVDTVTGSTWDSRLWDASAAAMQRGGSGETLAFDDVGDIASALTLATADAATNADIGDQVGNKEDTAIADTIEGNAATTQSLNRLAKAILQRLGADSANNTAATTLVGANRDGSILERLEDLRQNESSTGGLVYQGSCDAGMGASTITVVSADLAGQGNDFFNNKYYMMVLLNASTPAGAPESEVRQITDYVSATGTFTVTAFSVNVEASDEILIMHESLVLLGRDDANNTMATTNVVANADGSVLERLEVVQQAVGGVDTAANVLGADNANNAFASTNVVANGDGSILERLETIQAAAIVIDEFHDVPAADNVLNAQINEVIGNKTDAAAAGAVTATDTLVGYTKQLVTELQVVDGFHDVPAADVGTNAQVRDVVGNKTDAAAAGDVSAVESLMAYAKQAVTELSGTAGITTFPAAAAPANGVALADVLREVYDQGEKVFTNAAATLVDATTIFTITGGPIAIVELVARCVTGNDVTASTLQWRADPTDGASATISGASASLASALAGANVALQGGTLATVPLLNATSVNLGQQVTNTIIIGAGVLQTVVGVGSTTGTWMHHLRYKPCSRGVVIT